MLIRKLLNLAVCSLTILVLLLMVVGTTKAQSTATLQGTVTDQRGAVVPNATVTVRNRGTSFERTTQTLSLIHI